MTAANGRRQGETGGDTVSAVVRQWQAVHPGLDTGPMEIIGRINRCAGWGSPAPNSTCSARSDAPAMN